MLTKYFSAGLLLISALLVLSCTRTTEYPIEETAVDGIRTLHNPSYPKNGYIEYDLIDDLVIGENTVDDDYMQSHPFQIDVDAQGNIYVLDWDDYRIQVYDSSGIYLRTIGRKGQGPGEFMLPASFGITSSQKLILIDSKSRRLSLYTLEGELIRSERYDGGYKNELKVGSMNEFYLKVKEDDPRNKLTDQMQVFVEKFSIERHAPAGEAVKFGPFDGKAYTMMDDGRGHTLSVSSSNVPLTVWAPGPDGKMYYGHSSTYLVNQSDSSGIVHHAFGRDFQPVPNPYSGRGANTDHLPVFYNSFLFDEEGNIWIRPYTKEEDVVLYDIWSPEGVYLYQVSLAHAVRLFRNNRAYAILRPAEDVPTIRRFKLVKKED